MPKKSKNILLFLFHRFQNKPGSLTCLLDYFLIITFLFLLISPDLYAQSYASRTFDENNGLPSNDIYDMIIDHDNLLWVATRNGIASFDGNNWETYSFPHSTPHNEYHALTISDDGRLFALTLFYEVAEFVNGKWIDRSIDNPFQHKIRAIEDFYVVDWNGHKTFFINDVTNGIVYSRDGKWHKIEDDNLYFRLYSMIHYDNKFIAAGLGGLVIVSEDSIVKISASELNLPNDKIYGVSRIADYYGEGYGLWLSGSNWLAKHVNGKTTVYDHNNRIKHLDENKGHVHYDAAGNGFIFGSADKAYRLFPSGEISEWGSKEGLATDGITDLARDHEGNYWISSKRGLTKLFSLQIINYYTTDGLLEDEVTAVNQFDDGTLIFGHNRGLTIKSQNRIRHIPISDAEFRVRIMDIEKDHNGDMWVCASRAGVARIGQDFSLKWYRAPESEIPLSFVCMVFDRENNPIIGTNLGFYNIEDGKLVPSIMMPAEINSRNIIIDEKGALYFANKYEGLGVYFDGKFKTYKPVLNTMNQIYSIYITRDGRILAGTKGGLGIVQNDEIIPYDIDDRYIENSIYFINEDKVGNLWLGTDQGVYIWDNIRLQQYVPSNGLSGMETNRASGYCAANGDFYVGTSSGLSRFILRSAKERFVIKKPVINFCQILLGDVEYVPESKDKITHGTDILVKYRMISYMEGRPILYSVKLQKSNGQIIDEFTTNSARYKFINLNPGKYKISISARRADGKWSDEISTGIIQIKPQFYAHPFFILLAIAFSVLLLFVFYNYLSKSKIEKLKLELKSEKAKEDNLEDPSFEQFVQRVNFGIISLYANGSIININSAFARMLGYEDKDKVLEKNFFMNIIERYVDRDRLIETIDVNNIFSGFQTSLRKKDGGFIYVSLSGKVNRDNNNSIEVIEAIVEDISSKEQVINEMKRLARVVEQATEYIFITDKKGKIIYINPAFEKMSGYHSSAVLDKEAILFKDEEQNDEFYYDIWKTVKSGETWEGSLRGKDIHGNGVYLDTIISPLRDMYGNVKYIVSTSRDVTRQIELEKQLFQSQKMEAFGQLAGGVAHDFNNIVQAIVGFSDLALLNDNLDSKTAEMLEEIRLASGRASSLITRLMSFSRKEEIGEELHDLNQIISEMLEMLNRLLGENIDVSHELIDRELIIKGDRNQIEQILLNLFVNARDALDENGAISIKSGLIHFFEENLPPYKDIKAGKYAYFVVEDNGCGIPGTAIEHVYDPFFTSKKDKGGTGLGLSIVYNIIKKHNGIVNIDSDVGKGTKFTVFLPLKEKTGEKSDQNFSQSDTLKGSGTILFAEDDEQVRGLATNILEFSGYEVITAVDGQDAIEKFEANAEKIDLAIIDVIMPRKNGKQVFDQIRKIKADQKMWFISGYSETIIKSSFLPGEEVDFLRKPFAPRELLTRIKKSLNGD